MSSTAVILLIISACLHAGWNFLGKKVSPSATFFLLANTAGGIVLSPLAMIHADKIQFIPDQVWMLIAGSGLFLAIYLWGLAGAYRHGAISVAYPLLRATPVLMITGLISIFGEAPPLTYLLLTGIVMIAVGCILLPITNIRSLSMRHFFNLSCMFAFIGALGTVGYTIIDSYALSLLRQSEQLTLSVGEISLLYLFFINVSCSLWLSLYVLSSRPERLVIAKASPSYLLKAAMTGIMIALQYSLVLISMAFVENVSYVVAFRQLSIPLTVLLGICLLKEPRSPAMLLGMSLTFGGIILVSLG